MPLLPLKTSIFIEFENILYDTDTFVLETLYESTLEKDYDVNEDCFILLSNLISKYGADHIQYISQFKNNPNPLMDLLNEDIIENRQSIADTIYDEILYPNSDDESLYENLVLTHLGSSIEQLLKDENLDKLYIYVGNPTYAICNFLVLGLAKNDKVELITGNKYDFFNKIKCNSYFISESMDIDEIVKGIHDKDDGIAVDIVVPKYNFNIDDEEELLYLDYLPSEYMDNYNIHINSVDIPIV